MEHVLRMSDEVRCVILNNETGYVVLIKLNTGGE